MTEPIADLYQPLEFVGAALKRLGKSIAASTPLSSVDAQLYRDFTTDAARRAALVAAFLQTSSISELMFSDPIELDIRARAKNRLTLAEKLRRDPGVQLPSIQDVAGVRVVGDLKVVEQRVLAIAVGTAVDTNLGATRPHVIHDRKFDTGSRCWPRQPSSQNDAST